jgi:hypothetical protein
LSKIWHPPLEAVLSNAVDIIEPSSLGILLRVGLSKTSVHSRFESLRWMGELNEKFSLFARNVHWCANDISEHQAIVSEGRVHRNDTSFTNISPSWRTNILDRIECIDGCRHIINQRTDIPTTSQNIVTPDAVLILGIFYLLHGASFRDCVISKIRWNQLRDTNIFWRYLISPLHEL